MHHHHPFQESFWSPTSSIDALPNYTIGFKVLHDKLKQSMSENKVIIEYIKQRIAAEKSHAFILSTLIPATNNPFDHDIGGGLKRCFEVVYSESLESSKEHQGRAEDLNTTALDPLSKFSARYDRIITQAKETVEAQIALFETLCKHMEQAKTLYQTRCKALLIVQPQYTEDGASKVKVGMDLEFPTRDHVWIWLQEIEQENVIMTRDSVLTWLASKSTMTEKKEQDALFMLENLEKMDFIIYEEEEEMNQAENGSSIRIKLNKPGTPTSENKGFAGFLGRWSSNAGGQSYKRIELVSDMLEADKNYRLSLEKVEKMRTQVEQVLFLHYDEMESLELERIQTIKQVFISVAASLSNTIPRCKETFDNMMLYQETLKPDKDVQLIVEQYRTGHFCPKPILYENYFHGTAIDQLFGVPLEEITKAQSTLVPQLISQGLSVIGSGFSRLYDEEKNVVWTTTIPLDRVHAAREEINHQGNITIEALQKFDLLLIASLVRLYLMELPECLFTFELYEPCKLLYANQTQQDKDSRLISISKLLTTLPSSNYHTIMTLLGHFHKLDKELHNRLSNSLAKSFGSILMRPQTESKLNVHDHHPQKLIQDLIENYEIVFTKESSKAQEENSNRPNIVVEEKKKSNSLDNDTSSTNSTTRTSTSSTRRSSSILNFMKSSHSTPTSSTATKRAVVIPMRSSSTLFEDPDELVSSESSILIHTPPATISVMSSSKDQYQADHFMMDELASLDSFFEDEED